MQKFQILIIIIILIISTFVIFQFFNQDAKISNQDETIKFFKFEINFERNKLHKVNSLSTLFNVYGENKNYVLIDNTKTYWKLLFEPKIENYFLYDELKYDGKQKTVVIYSSFTASAYEEPGFYNYYTSECDSLCLTVPITNSIRTEMGGNAIQILKLLDYNFLSDKQIDKNPELLENFDKVILLHNEYVTKKMFEAFTNHPKVIYLYPNALYAEVQSDYDKNTITLVRGHAYPEKSIVNGFDWEFENTDPYEYDQKCENWNFYEITNGYMLNCYPELALFSDKELLRTIKEI